MIRDAVLILSSVIVAVAVYAQPAPIQRILDVRFGQRTIAVADPNRKTLTLTPGDDLLWICAPHSGGKSCKTAYDVAGWILENGDGPRLEGTR